MRDDLTNMTDDLTDNLTNMTSLHIRQMTLPI